MKNFYNSEIEGMVDFWKELDILPDYELNTDGRYKGNLVEFKLVFQDLKKHKEQLRRYLKAYNSCALPIPKYSYLISLNQKKYIKINNETENVLEEKKWNSPLEFIKEFNLQNDFIKGWIDEFSIVSYNNKLCENFSRIFKSKEDVKREFINPQFSFIKEFDWDSQIKKEKNDKKNIGWLHFNMNMLGPSLLKKQLGAFFTPEKYVLIATEMVRDAIKRVPKGNDYIILDRCAGTGNLERFLREDELSHCILNTYDYTEWTTLKGLYDGRVKMIIPPTRNQLDMNNRLLTNGDALSSDFYNFCFTDGLYSLLDKKFIEQSKLLNSWLTNKNMTIIMLENPPFVEPQGGASQGKKTFTIKEKFLYKEMGKEKFRTKNVNRASENLFIWSAYKYFLKKPEDSYILFSPIKYWKSQQIINKKFIDGYICNRSLFNASEGGILLIHWQNIDSDINEINVNSDLGRRIVKRMYYNPARLLSDSNNFTIAYLFNLSNVPKNDNGKLINDIEAYANYCKVQKAYRLGKDNILKMLPLWCANCYEYNDYTEREVVMKTSDKGDAYINDNNFLKDCFIWTLLSQKNKCVSNERCINQLCLCQNTESDNILKTLRLNNNDMLLLNLWKEIICIAKRTCEFNQKYNYGLFQLDNEINIKIESGFFNKKGEPLMISKYEPLDEKIKYMKDLLKNFYKTNINNKLFLYELLK